MLAPSERKKFGIVREHVSDFQRKEVKPGLAIVTAIAIILGCLVVWFFGTGRDAREIPVQTRGSNG